MSGRNLSLVATTIACLGVLSGGGCRSTVVVESRWDEVGSLLADFNTDHGQIDARGEGRFRAIRIDAAGADVEMYDVKATFGNGEVFIPSIRHHFQQGSTSRVIELPGGLRHIKKIEFWYKAANPGGGQARIVVWGLR